MADVVKRAGTAGAAICATWPELESTMILVPTVTRLYRSVTSAFVSRMQPLETRVPIVAGALVPWIR